MTFLPAPDRRRRPRAGILAGVVALALAGAGCSTDGASAQGDGTPTTSSPAASSPDTSSIRGSGDEPAHPGDDWDRVDAADAGIDPTVIDEMAERAEAGMSNCLVVTRGGTLVDERYWQGTDASSVQEVFSASKSVTSTLVGIASDDGDLSVEDPAARWIPGWRGTRSEGVTVEHLLNNTSGREQTLAIDYVEMAARARDKTAFAVALGQDAEPGTTWVYNNSAIQTLEQVMQEATGEDLAEFAQERLFGPIGMADSYLARDRAGNPMTFMGVQSTCRDMARFGHLMLRDGTWDGEQVVSADWVERATGASSQDLNSAYGWLWWVNRPGTVLGAARASGGAADDGEEQLVPGAPEDMFFALGLGGQIIAVDPGSDTVVVRLGPSTYPEGVEKFQTEDSTLVATDGITGSGPSPSPR